MSANQYLLGDLAFQNTSFMVSAVQEASSLIPMPLAAPGKKSQFLLGSLDVKTVF
jgi:hypothetical protein